MDPAKKAKSVILNPHLWSLKRLQQRPRGRPRKNPAPEKFRKSLTSGKQSGNLRVEKILSLDSISSPSPSMEIQIMGGKISLSCKGKTLLGVVNKLLKTKGLLTMPSNVLALYLKQTFLPIIWIFTEGDEIKSRLPFKIFSTLTHKIKSTKN